MAALRYAPFLSLSAGPLDPGSDTTQLSNGRFLPARATNRKTEALASHAPFARMHMYASHIHTHALPIAHASHIMPFALHAHIMKLHHHAVFMQHAMLHHMHHMHRMYHAHIISQHVCHASHASHPRKACHRTPRTQASHVSQDTHRTHAHQDAHAHKAKTAQKQSAPAFPFARQQGCCSKCGTDKIPVFFTAVLSDDQKRGQHPLKGLTICRQCRQGSEYYKDIFRNQQWTIPDDIRPIQCDRCKDYHIKPFYINNKQSADLGRRHLCADCTDYAYERIGCHKSNYEFMQLPGPHLHPEHPQIRGLI